MSLQCEVVLRQPADGVSRDNCNVCGIVKYSVKKILKVSHITLSVEGVGRCEWTEWRQYGRIVCPHFYSGVERHVTGRSRLVEPIAGEKLATIQPGEYEFPFSVLIPRGVASSFEYKEAHIRYKVEVTVSIPWQPDLKFRRPFTVCSQLDLNLTPELRAPAVMRQKATLYNFIARCGEMKVKVRTLAGGFVPGQTMPVLCTILNHSKVRVKHLIIALLRVISYTSESGRQRQQPITTVESVRVLPQQSGAVYAAHAEIKIPANAMISMLNSKIISVVYNLKVTVQISGIHLNPIVTVPIVIGTVPISDAPAAADPAPTSDIQDLASNDSTSNIFDHQTVESGDSMGI